MKTLLPVLKIENFRHFSRDHDFYAESLLPHIQQHDFTNKPHKHDFFLVVIFTRGSGTHEIDFTRYKIKPGAVFILSPGQTHHWTLSKDIAGLIFLHSRAFFDQQFTGSRLRDFPFFSSIHDSPLLQLKNHDIPKIKSLFTEIKREYSHDRLMKAQKLPTLVNLLYIELSRLTLPKVRLKSSLYLSKLRLFEDLLENHFKDIKFPSQYAEMMAISERHLNRISRTCLGKTSTDLIQDRIILEAKRLLMRPELTISQIADELGYDDNSYFSRFFKHRTGLSPRKFMGNY